MEQLFREYRSIKDCNDPKSLRRMSELESTLVQMNIGMLKKEANTVNCNTPFKDLVQAGAVGLIHAIRTYDPDRGATFYYYAKPWVKSTIGIQSESLKDTTVHIPRHIRTRTIKELRKCQHQMSDETEYIVNVIAIINIDAESTNNTPLKDTIKQETFDDPDHNTLKNDISTTIKNAMKKITKDERTILKMIFVNNMSLRDIGNHFDCSHEYIRKIRDNVFNILKRELRHQQ